MRSLFCNIWDDFSWWVSVQWSQVVFVLVICMLSILAFWTLLALFKNTMNKGRKFSWGKVVWIVVLFVIIFVLCLAKFN